MSEVRFVVSCRDCKSVFVYVICCTIYAAFVDLHLAPTTMNRLFGSSATKKPKPTLQDAINSVRFLCINDLGKEQPHDQLLLFRQTIEYPLSRSRSVNLMENLRDIKNK